MKNLSLIRNSRILFLAAMVMSLVFTSCKSDDEEDDSTDIGNWIEKSSLDGDKRSKAASFVIGDKGYIVSGFIEDGDEYATDTWVYDSTSNFWMELADFPGVGREDAVGFAVNGKGYVGLGYDGDNFERLKDFYEYDPATDTWTKISSFLDETDEDVSGRRGAVAFTIGDYAYVGLGYDGSTQKDFWKYDPSTDTWEQEFGFGGDKREDASVFVIDEVAYIFGGQDNGTLVTDFYSFDGTTWTELNDTDSDDDNQVFVYAGAAFSIDGKGYVATGIAGSINSNVWEYNPSNDSWTGLASFEGTSRQDANAFTFEDSAYVLLGENGSSQFDDIWYFEPNVEQDSDD